MRAERYKAGGNVQKGEITAFLSLIFLLILSFLGAIIESTSIQVLKNHKRADTSLALESVFAEYQRELLEEYDIFALDGSYGEGKSDEKKIIKRLEYYGAQKHVNRIQHSELLTDHQGAPFYRQAVKYMKSKIGMTEDKKEHSYWEEQQESGTKFEKEEEEVEENLDSMLGEAEESLPSENNPMESVTAIQKSGLLKIIVENPEQLSKKSIKKEELASTRKLNKGKGTFVQEETKTGIAESLFFKQYLLEHFGDVTEEKEERALDYELEYLLGGHASDRENLEEVVKKILPIRLGINYAYLLTDEAKKAEAEVLALSLCTLLTVPGITEVVKHAILLAWAYGEGIVDLRGLVAGEKVPVVKTKENWSLQLSALLEIKEQGVPKRHQDNQEGMGYRDYLKGLLILEKQETLSMRALDLIEKNLNLRADQCIMRLEIESVCTLRRGIQYEFSTYFGYQ